MSYHTTQCHLPSSRRDISALTPAEAGTRFSDPGGMQVDLGTAVEVCSPCPRLHITMAFVINTTAAVNLNLGPLMLQSCALTTRTLQHRGSKNASFWAFSNVHTHACTTRKRCHWPHLLHEPKHKNELFCYS